jgi:esterase/lipase
VVSRVNIPTQQQKNKVQSRELNGAIIMGTSRIFQTGLTSLALLGLLATSACAKPDTALEPSGAEITAPAAGTSFDDYVQSTRQQLRDVLTQMRFSHEEKPFGDHTIDQVVDMRAPYTLGPVSTTCTTEKTDQPRGNGVGFLMVHGLTDSPYWLSDIRDDLRNRFPCATFHGVLLPGHGTVPGDLIDVEYEDWLETVRFGLNSFGDEVEHIIPMGFSTGAALIGRVYNEEPDKDRVSALVMLSPGLGAKSEQAWLTPYVRYVKDWVGVGENNDPGKYGSMAMNAAAEFYLLTKPFGDGSLSDFDVPVFGVVSSDDQTINPERVSDFFCNKVTSAQKQLIWYQGEIPTSDGGATCDGIDVVRSENHEMRTLNHAHTAITMSPQDPIYGLDGVVPDCGHYDDETARSQCQSGVNILYGERNLFDAAPAGTMRRGTFNPDFPGMMDKMAVFIAKAITAND